MLEADGKPTEAVISQGNSRTKLGEANATPQPLGEKGLKPEEAALLTTLPPPAKSFILYFDQGTVTPTAESQSVLDRASRRNRVPLRTPGRSDRPYGYGRQRRG